MRNRRRRWPMNFQKMFRTTMVVAGLGVALSLVGPAYAQQEVNPTFFDDSLNMERIPQPVVTSNAAAPAAAANLAAPVNAQQSAAPAKSQTAGLASVDSSAAVLVAVGLGSIGLMGLATAVRGNRRMNSRIRASRNSFAGATLS